MALTARRVGGEEAVRIGLATRCFESQGAMMAHVMQVGLWGQGRTGDPLVLSEVSLVAWGVQRQGCKGDKCAPSKMRFQPRGLALLPAPPK